MLPLLLLLAAGFYVGWNIGANDAANAMGTSFGSGLLSYRCTIALVVIFVVLGAVTQSHGVMRTIGKGIVPGKLTYLAVGVALLAAGVFVTLVTTLKLPVSTSQAIVGAVAGVGVALHATINWHLLGSVVFCWIVLPAGTAALAFGLHWLFVKQLRKIKGIIALDKIFKILVTGSGCYVAFSLGANDVGNAVGPLMGLGFGATALSLLGAFALSVGAVSYGKRVMETIGKSITPLGPASASAAQFSAAVGVHLFTIIGMPVSTSQAIVGAVAGAGLVKGIAAVSKRRLLKIGIGWIATPTVAGLLAFGLYMLLA